MTETATIVILGGGTLATAAPGVEVVAADDAGAWTKRVRTPFLAFLRPGDTFLPGKLERQCRDMATMEDAVLTYTSYRIVNQAGATVDEVRSGRQATSRPDDLLLSHTVEASTVMVRREALGARVCWSNVTRPGGDAACWAELGDSGELRGIDEVLSEVRLDPARHGLDQGHERERLLTILHSPACRGAVASTLRRRLLRVLYVDIDPAGARPPTQMPPLWPTLPQSGGSLDDERDAVIRDLVWTLERQTERFSADDRNRPPSKAFDADVVRAWPDAQIAHLVDSIAEVHGALLGHQERVRWLEQLTAERDRTIIWLRAEVQRLTAENHVLRLRRGWRRA